MEQVKSMFDTIPIPVISPSSGPAQDGLLLGRINASDLLAAFLVQKIVNVAALAGGLAIGQLYRSGADPDVVSVVH